MTTFSAVQIEKRCSDLERKVSHALMKGNLWKAAQLGAFREGLIVASTVLIITGADRPNMLLDQLSRKRGALKKDANRSFDNAGRYKTSIYVAAMKSEKLKGFDRALALWRVKL